MAVESKQYSLNRNDFSNWLRNTRTFLAPLAILYLGFVIANIQANGAKVIPEHFIPDATVTGGVTLYVLNSLFDLFRKWSGGK